MSLGTMAAAHVVPANIGYRRFNGTTDTALLNLGNVASQSSLDCWIAAVRFLSGAVSNGGVIIDAPSFDPLNWFLNKDDGQHNLADSSANSAGLGKNNPTYSLSDGFVIVANRRVASTVLRWSKAIYSGTWGAFTHVDGINVFANLTYPASGVLSVSDTLAPCNLEVALIARCTSASDAQINTLSGGLSAWSALPNLTNLWRFDGVGGAGAINDLKGTATQNSITGTTVTAGGFPLAA